MSSQSLEPDPEKVASIRNWPTPTTSEQALSFIGLCNYYRRLVAGFLKLAAPLLNFAHKREKWSTTQDDSFRIIKEKLISYPTIVIPNPNADQKFRLTTDAYECAIGAVLKLLDETDNLLNKWYMLLQASRCATELIGTRERVLCHKVGAEAVETAPSSLSFRRRGDHFSLQY